MQLQQFKHCTCWHKKVVIISGRQFSARTVNAIAKQAGSDEVLADQLPEDKVEPFALWLLEYKHVKVVGDGGNDAPAMAIASIGIALWAVLVPMLLLKPQTSHAFRMGF
ncbi:MAG: HAD family hydrolase [Ignavibacteria bacterium]|nr:HAD family hydrolase [Ignavibacteria bacterium]